MASDNYGETLVEISEVLNNARITKLEAISILVSLISNGIRDTENPLDQWEVINQMVIDQLS